MKSRQTRRRSTFAYWTAFATLLTLVVILLGAFTRLDDAGLGCPDWPGCYGQAVVPHTATALTRAAKAYPHSPVEIGKAWAEMIHRYIAGGLGILVMGLAVCALWIRRTNPRQVIFAPCCLVAIVIFQAILGMWTVTWKLYPLVVMGHLLGGMTIASFLWWLTVVDAQRVLNVEIASLPARYPGLARIKPWLWLGLFIVVLQISLGGWTSSNYAALICSSEFPGCHGQLFPAMDFARGFNLFSPIGANYQGGALGTAARTAIHMTHRYGAVITTIYLGGLTLYLLLSAKTYTCRHFGWLLFAVLGAQVSLGILNVIWLLPMAVAIAHNAFAALLLLLMVTFLGQSRRFIRTL